MPAPEVSALDAPARVGKPKPGVGAERKRLGSDGPPPTLRKVRRQGCTGISVKCLSLWRDHTSHHTGALAPDGLVATDGIVFLDLCRSLRLICGPCGGRTMHIVPPWPDIRQKRAASLGVDIQPAMPGTALGFRMPGAGETPVA